MKSKLFALSLTDWQKAFIMAFLGGLILPIAVALKTPDFSIWTADWSALFQLSLNGAFVAGMSYLTKNFFSDTEGTMFGTAR